MKTNKLVKKSGPYHVVSISQSEDGLRLVVFPAFPEYGDGWAVTREKGEGGGPSIFAAIALATELQKFLNQPYTEAEVQKWKETLKEGVWSSPKG